MSQRDILAAAARRFADNPTDPNLVDLFNAVMELPFAEMPAAYLERPLTFKSVPAGASEADPGLAPPTITSLVEPAIPCKVCGNRPDEDGWIEHGRGCHVLSADGGGSEYVGTETL